MNSEHIALGLALGMMGTMTLLFFILLPKALFRISRDHILAVSGVGAGGRLRFHTEGAQFVIPIMQRGTLYPRFLGEVVLDSVSLVRTDGVMVDWSLRFALEVETRAVAQFVECVGGYGPEQIREMASRIAEYQPRLLLHSLSAGDLRLEDTVGKEVLRTVVDGLERLGLRVADPEFRILRVKAPASGGSEGEFSFDRLR